VDSSQDSSSDFFRIQIRIRKPNIRIREIRIRGRAYVPRIWIRIRVIWIQIPEDSHIPNRVDITLLYGLYWCDSNLGSLNLNNYSAFS
jgi:hypothetical protein